MKFTSLSHPHSSILLRRLVGVGLVATCALHSAVVHAQVPVSRHQAVSADVAAQAMAQGASVLDVRSVSAFDQGHLAGAVQMNPDAGYQTVAVLQQWTSLSGADLSRTVVVVGEPGDANAQALWQTLSLYATGRVLWLVGGTAEWRMTGRALSTQRSAVKAVPQHWVHLNSQPTQVRMAGQSLRAQGELTSKTLLWSGLD